MVSEAELITWNKIRDASYLEHNPAMIELYLYFGRIILHDLGRLWINTVE